MTSGMKNGCNRACVKKKFNYFAVLDPRERGEGVRERGGKIWVCYLREFVFGLVWLCLGYIDRTQTDPNKPKFFRDSLVCLGSTQTDPN